MAHLMFCLRRQPHLSREEFQHYWRTVHAPLVHERAKAMGVTRYVQSHSLPESAVGRMASVRGSPPGFDGIAQLWWDAKEMTAEEKDAARRANAELLEDERRFIDLAASPIFIVEDHEVLQFYADARGAAADQGGQS